MDESIHQDDMLWLVTCVIVKLLCLFHVLVLFELFKYIGLTGCYQYREPCHERSLFWCTEGTWWPKLWEKCIVIVRLIQCSLNITICFANVFLLCCLWWWDVAWFHHALTCRSTGMPPWCLSLSFVTAKPLCLRTRIVSWPMQCSKDGYLTWGQARSAKQLPWNWHRHGFWNIICINDTSPNSFINAFAFTITQPYQLRRIMPVCVDNLPKSCNWTSNKWLTWCQRCNHRHCNHHRNHLHPIVIVCMMKVRGSLLPRGSPQPPKCWTHLLPKCSVPRPPNRVRIKVNLLQVSLLQLVDTIQSWKWRSWSVKIKLWHAVLLVCLFRMFLQVCFFSFW